MRGVTTTCCQTFLVLLICWDVGLGFLPSCRERNRAHYLRQHTSRSFPHSRNLLSHNYPHWVERFETTLYASPARPDQNLNSHADQEFLRPSPEIAAILMVYFVQGALGIARLAQTFFYKDQLGMSPAEVAALTGITALPWIVKPLYGFLSDGLPIFGYRRRSYLALSGLLGCTAWLALSKLVSSPTEALLASTLASLSVAISDVVADSIVVEKSRESSKSFAGDLQSLCWGAASAGAVITSYFSGSLLEILSARDLFAITAVFPLLVSLTALAITESKVQGPTNLNEFKTSILAKTQQLKEAFLLPTVALPVLFVAIWQATPTSDSAFFYFLTNELHFQPEFLGKVRFASSIASLVGVIVYRTFLKEKKISDVILVSSVASVPLGLSQILLTTHLNQQLGIPDQVFAFGDSVILTVLGQIAFMPTLVLAARVCPPGVEGALFALLMSIYNAGGAVSAELGALLTSFLNVTDKDFTNLGLLIGVCNMASLLPLPLIGWISKAEADDQTK